MSLVKVGNLLPIRVTFCHHEKVHTGLRPFASSECGKSFTDNSALHCHHKVHTRELPCKCDEYGK